MLATAAFICALTLTAGCSAPTRIFVLPVEQRQISMHEDLVVRYDLPPGDYWVNDDDELCLVFTLRNGAGGDGPGHRAFDLSLLLGPPPANLGRNYTVDRRTLRALITDASRQRRFGSLYGIVGVWFEEPGAPTLHGRFRIWAKRQDYSIWRRWGAGGRVLFVCRFPARPDAQRRRRAWQRTDSGSMKRPPVQNQPRPVTGPPVATQPGR
ncbi:MAG: hypothetical protein IID40_00090 [Planctomycetes bacterium]|nr:hypothetical protein [Planctomycetota bacterium]